MAEALKNHFGAEIPRKIASMISAAFPAFPADAFVKDALRGYHALDLMPRGWKIAEALRSHLPDDYSKAVGILLASLGPKLERTENNGMAPFLYMPHAFFVAKYGLGHFEESMRAQYELTQRFTAEFSIRPYLMHHQQDTLARLKAWREDTSEHVRRLVSEGTRPRLPWAPRLRAFQADPRPVLGLLEGLKDDPSLYVRRSVANNLNDIGKDHPPLLEATARAWMQGASEERQWLVRHALRSAVKRGDKAALGILGFGRAVSTRLRKKAIVPPRVKIGGSATVSFEVENTGSRREGILVDLRVHYVKSGGKTGAKTFKLKAVELDPGQAEPFRKTISFKQMTTRKHYPGAHRVEVLLNGAVAKLGTIEVMRG